VPAPTVAQGQVIIDWLTGLGWNVTQETGYPLLDGTYIAEAPDKVVLITPTGGPGYVTEEGTADAWSFQARVRGEPEDPFGPQLAAQQLDYMILNAPFPVTVDGVVIPHAHRAAGPPTPLPVDTGDLRREYTCSYLFITGV
jgi:hypothetical protein